MLAGFHDANIVALELKDEKILEIVFLAEQQKKKMIVYGLEKLRVSDFEEGNIVSRVYYYSEHDSVDSANYPDTHRKRRKRPR